VLPFMQSYPLLATLCVGALGFGDAIVQGSIFGLVGMFHPRYTGAVMTGNAVAGVAISILRVATKSLSAWISNANSAKLYFLVSDIVLVICIFVYYFVLRRSPVTLYYMTKGSTANRTKYVTESETELQQSGFWTIFTQIWDMALLASLNLFITLALFPGITASIPSTIKSLNDTHWMSIILITEFNVFDLIGRYITRYDGLIFFTPKTLWIPSLLRVLLFPAFIFQLHPRYLDNDIFAYLFMAIFSFSSGYLATLAMMYGPERCKAQDKERAGTISIFFLTIGLTGGVWTGSLLNFLIFTKNIL